MRLARRVLPALALLAILAFPLVALAQMGPLGTRDVPPHGTILTDAAGRTVYMWEADTQGAGTSACYDACAGAWPPVPVSESEMMDMMMMMPDMSMNEMMMNMQGPGTIQRTDGTYQATFNGWPLYYFVRDTAPGEANGHNSMGFGARWAVIPADMMSM